MASLTMKQLHKRNFAFMLKHSNLNQILTSWLTIIN